MGNDIQEDYINQSVLLSAEAIFNFYSKVLEISSQVDITDTELIQNIHKLSAIAKGLVYSHSTLSDYAKLETVKAAIKTLNGIQKHFQEEPQDISQEAQKDCVDALIDYLQTIAKDDQLELFEL